MGILSPFSSREKKAKEVKRSKCKGDGPFNPTVHPSGLRKKEKGRREAGGGGGRHFYQLSTLGEVEERLQFLLMFEERGEVKLDRLNATKI